MKKNLFLKLFFLISLVHQLPLYSVTEFEIIIPTYNNQKWCIQNLKCLANQTYEHWHATIIVDCASDDTAQLLENYITHHRLENKVTLIVNEERRGAMANIYYAASTCPPHKIIGLLDGDDWLFDNDVLAYYKDIYETYDIWVTYGQFMLWPSYMRGWCTPYRPETIKKNEFRKVSNFASHFRTFYAWLFQEIDPNDFLYEGEFLPMTWDQAIMFPLMEMAGKRHFFVSRLTYIYNEDNPINDHKVNQELQQQLAKFIRAKPAYQTLKYKYPPNKHKKKVKRK